MASVLSGTLASYMGVTSQTQGSVPAMQEKK